MDAYLQMVSDNKCIARNTVLLYFRMFLVMAVSLYTSRIILNALGVEDFGIYSVVGGVVTMFAFLNAAMAASTQRFLTFELGKGDEKRLNGVFCMSLFLHLLIVILVVLFAETVGLWFVNYKLTIPESRMIAANWAYQFSVLSLVVTILSVPYNALIIAREKMNIFAYISIFEVALKLLIAYLILWSPVDKLIFYSFLLFMASLVIRITYGIYCHKYFTESRYHFIWDKELFCEMKNFAGWNLFGVFAGITSNQGINVLLNLFFGPVVNAARSIAYQVMGAVNQLVTNFQLAVNPPITKKYAMNEKEDMNNLIFFSSKYSYFLLFFFALPLISEMDFVLRLWLKNVPDYTSVFTRLVLADVLLCSISGPLHILVQATGKVKIYQMIVSTVLLLNLPVAYLLLLSHYSPVSVFILAIVLSFVALIARMIVLHYLTAFPVWAFIRKVIFPISKVTLIAVLLLLSVEKLLSGPWEKFLGICFFSVLFISVSVWFLGASSVERYKFKLYIIQKVKK